MTRKNAQRGRKKESYDSKKLRRIENIEKCLIKRILELEQNQTRSRTKTKWEWWKIKSLKLECRDCLVVRLKAMKCYERFLCYLSFLFLSSGLFICLVPFVIRFFFIGLVEVIGRRYSFWNHPPFLLYIKIWYYPEQFQVHDLVDQLSSHYSPTKLLSQVP